MGGVGLMDEPCVCGHEEDEHDLTGECQVDECPCIAYEPESWPDE